MYKIVFKSNEVKSFKTLFELCGFCALSESEVLDIMSGKCKNNAIKRIVLQSK